MIANHNTSREGREARGISVMIVAVGMIFILGMAGLAIDLASLYVGRSQAQRAADAGALAGAQALVDGSCVPDSTGTISGACVVIAQQRAAAVANQNLIAGVSPDVSSTSDVTVDTTVPNDPQVTVYAGRGTYNGSNHSNALPTFFVKVFGVDSANVSAKATAEAFNPSGSGLPIGVKCVKPWFFPNCDPGNTTGTPNTDCSPATGPFVVDDGSGNLTVARPGQYPGTGVYGEPFTMKPGSPGGAAAPGQYYAAYIPNTTQMPTYCPACAKSGGSGGGTGSAAVYRANIECCNQNTVVCGLSTVTIASSAGNMVGPTNQGVDCLIQQNPGCGQDHLQGVASPCTAISSPPKSDQIANYPFTVIPGANNQYAKGAAEIPMSNSNSVVAVPIYKGILQSGQNTVNVVGFLKVFLQYDDSKNQGTIYAYVLDVTACGNAAGSSSGGSGTDVISTGGATIPVRLIRAGS